jgi:hypothetical protein
LAILVRKIRGINGKMARFIYDKVYVKREIKELEKGDGLRSKGSL